MKLFGRPLTPRALAALNDFGVQAYRFFGVHLSLLAPGVPPARSPWDYARVPLCELIRKRPEMVLKCDASERALVRRASGGSAVARCHAGLCHLAIPLRRRGKLGGHLVFSPFRRPGDRPAGLVDSIFASAWPGEPGQGFLQGPNRRDANPSRAETARIAGQVAVMDGGRVVALRRFSKGFQEAFLSAVADGFPPGFAGHMAPVRSGRGGEVWLSFFWTMFVADPAVDLATLRSWPVVRMCAELVYAANGPCEVLTLRRTIPVPQGWVVLLPAGDRHMIAAPSGRPPLRVFFVSSLRLDRLRFTPVAARHRMYGLLSDLARDTAHRPEYAFEDEARRKGLDLLLELDRLADRPAVRRGRPPSIALNEAVERARQHLKTRLDRAVSLGELAQAAGISRHTLEHRFRAELGTSPIAFHRALRIGEARRLLATTRLSVTAIALRLGFPNPAHFGHVFAGATGRSPRRYRKEAISGKN